MRGKQILTILLMVLFLSTLTGCSGMGKAATNLEDAGYRLEEDRDFLDNFEEEGLSYIETSYAIYDEDDIVVGAIVQFNSANDMMEYFEEYEPERDLEKYEDSFYRDLFIIGYDDLIAIIKD